MNIRRNKEFGRLQTAYEDQKSRLVILTGRHGVGKTALLQDFAAEKSCFWYQAAECSPQQQFSLLRKGWQDAYGIGIHKAGGASGIEQSLEIKTPETFGEIFVQACLKATGKPVIIVEDFLRIAKGNPDFYTQINELMNRETSVMMVLTASTLQWQSEEAEIEPRSFVSSITDRIALKPFTFLETVQYFPQLPVGDIIEIYGLLGGIPGYLKYWNPEKSVEENVKTLFLQEDGALAKEAQSYLRTGLRELSLYNTVLSAMTGGVTRLNDIHEKTGFSRAKISVYMKNLNQLGVVDKAKTITVKTGDAQMKGMYTIADPLVHFWYRFLYPNQTLLLLISPQEFYERIIAPDWTEYVEQYFERVCVQYLELLNKYHKLSMDYEKAGAWFGMQGRIPFLAKNRDGQVLVMQCKWSKEPFSTQDLEKLLQYLMKAGITPECYYLFSRSDFTAELRKKAEYVKNMNLVDLKEL